MLYFRRFRYSDFKVNEVTLHGEVVRLTDTRPITGRQETAAAPQAAAAAADEAAKPEADPHAGAVSWPAACCACSKKHSTGEGALTDRQKERIWREKN